LLSADQRYVKFLWKIDNNKGAKDKDVEAVELYAIKGNRDNEPAMSGGLLLTQIHSISQENQLFRCK
jgi:SecD/SecF fusion protein